MHDRFHSKDLMSNSPYCLLYRSFYVTLENLVFDQLIIFKLIFFSIFITYLLGMVFLMSGEILCWSLMGFRGFAWGGHKRAKHDMQRYNRSNCTSSLIWITTQEDSSKTCLSTLGWMVDSNPLTLISDKHITSPCNIHTLSSKQVMRILKFIGQKLI